MSSKFELELGPVELVCLELGSKPSMAESVNNGITLSGADGQQSLTFLDPGGDVPDYILDLASVVSTPFGEEDVEVTDYSAGGC
ncbi:hypothetical protein ABT324_27495 [Saccharopolyspora sp. NPDC000359]|uniref:hypothetical protein n=1 Tax=Saccharopolyspora sp. NPDC000359 TaxID=3154251 RepID=UPI00331A2DA1